MYACETVGGQGWPPSSAQGRACSVSNRDTPNPSPRSKRDCLAMFYILNTPKRDSGIGALSDAEIARPSTMRVSAGSITPSSHSRADE